MTNCFSSIDFGWGWCLWLAEVEGGGFLLNNLRLDGTWPIPSWEEVRASLAASCELSGSWDLLQVLGKRTVFSTGLMAHLYPCSQGKEGSDKISLEEKCGRVVCATAAAHCLPPVGPTGLSLSDTYVTIRQARPEAWGMPGIVFQCFSSVPVSYYSPSLKSYLCTERERSWRSFFLPWRFFFLNAWVHSSRCLKTLLGNHQYL